VIDAASYQKDLVKSKFLWTDDRVSLYGSMPRLIKKSKFLWTDDRVSLYGSMPRFVL